MNNYPTILSVKCDDELIKKMDYYCEIEEQSRSGITRLAIKEFLRSPKVVQSLRDNEPVDFLMS